MKVLIADSQLLVAEALAIALSSRCHDIEVFDTYPCSGPDGVEAVVALRPDVALLDYWLQDMEASAVAFMILGQVPNTKIIHLSWFHGPNQVQESLASGAVGFLPKAIRVLQLANAIRQAHAGETPLLGDAVRALVEDVEERQRRMKMQWERIRTLTDRELEILTLLASALTGEEIGGRLGIKRHTVRKHIQNILEKLDARTQLEAVVVARDHGIVL